MIDLFLSLNEAGDSQESGEAAAIDQAQRDPTAFTVLYHRYVDRVFYYVLAKGDSRADAEEITAQVFLDALEGLPGYHHRGHFAAWLFAIARHRLADFYRRRPLERLDPAQGLATPSEDPLLARMIQVDHLHSLERLLMQLEERERELLRLRFSAGLSFRDIAALQGGKESAVKMRYYRLLARLQSQMEADYA